MNGTAIAASGLAGLPEIIVQITTRFPVTSYDSNSTLSADDYDGLADTIAYLTSIGVPVFGEFRVDYDNQNPVGLSIYCTTTKYIAIDMVSRSRPFPALAVFPESCLTRHSLVLLTPAPPL